MSLSLFGYGSKAFYSNMVRCDKNAGTIGDPSQLKRKVKLCCFTLKGNKKEETAPLPYVRIRFVILVFHG